MSALDDLKNFEGRIDQVMKGLSVFRQPAREVFPVTPIRTSRYFRSGAPNLLRSLPRSPR